MRRPPRALGFLLAAVAAVQCFAAPQAQSPVSVTFAHFNDVYEIDAVEGGAAGGMARLATMLDRLRRTSGPVVTTLGGDFLSPSALGTVVLNGEPVAGRQMIDLLNAVGLQWATLGNHEFDLSEAAFHKRVAEAKFKVVVSNVTNPAGQLFPGTVDSAVATVRSGGRTIRIGLIGLVIDMVTKPWVRYVPPIDAARARVASLRGKVDAIVALTHLNIEDDEALVEAVPEIDLVLGGHEHQNWLIRRGPAFVPIVKADANVRSLAVATLRFPPKGRPGVTVRFERLDRSVAQQPRTQALVRKWMETGYDAFRRQGMEPTEIVTTTTAALDGREQTVRNRAGALTALIVEALQREAQSDVAILNGGTVRIDDVLPAGPIRQYDIIRVLPFGGKVLKVTMEGAQLRQTLEAGEANIGSGGFLHLVGIRRQGDGWIVNGKPLDPAAAYSVAMPEYLMTGQESRMSFLTRDRMRGVEDRRDIRLVLIDELRRRFKPSR